MLRLPIISLLACLLVSSGAWGQTTRVRGRVTDATNGEPLQFASVVFPGTTVGATTDEDGVYSLETRDTVSMVQASIVGYESQTRTIAAGSFNTVDFGLVPLYIDIGAVTVTPGENPAFAILDSVRSRRRFNDPSEYDSYVCRTYTKSELGLTNFKSEFRSKRMQRNLGFVLEYVDTSALTGRTYLPAMISETSADLYHSRRPAVSREVIRANRVSGLDDSFAVAQFSGTMHGDVNFYDNFIDIFNVRFASPLADGGRAFYDYFLVDSLSVGGRKTYKIRFHPKRFTTPVLDGEVNIDSATYALQSASARMPRRVNVNWVKHLLLEAESRTVDDGRWFRSRDKVSAEFAVTNADSSRLRSFLGSREIVYDDVRIGVPLPEEVTRMDNNVVLAEGNVTRTDETFWDSVRPYALSEREKAITVMVDSVKHTRLYRDVYTIVNTLIVGYWNTKYIGIGPYYRLVSFNDLEGFRMQLGARTTSEVSRRLRLTGYAAYGFRDERFKGGGGAELVFGRSLTRKLSISGRRDVMQLGAGQTAMSSGNLFSSVFSRGGDRLTMVNRLEAQYEHEWRWGASSFVGGRMQRIFADGYVPMVRPGGESVKSVSDVALHVGMRLSWDEMVYRMIFDKQYLGSVYPILTLEGTVGLPDVLSGGSEYYRLEAGVQYKLELPPVGYSKITLRGGRIFGRVPYPLLKLHEGNVTYFYDPYAFSCMNFYEFASDKWLGWYYEHHFNGALLGRLPLVRRLKLREVVTCKGVWGSLDERNDGSLPDTRAPLLFPEGMSSVRDPYVEVGAGVENILRLFRVDCVWRLTHRRPVHGMKTQNFAVNLCMQVSF